jgi:hypothetical protein
MTMLGKDDMIVRHEGMEGDPGEDGPNLGVVG